MKDIKLRKRLNRINRLVRMTLDAFAQNNLGWLAVALSFFTTMSFIPLIAIIFSITDGFGLNEMLIQLLHKYSPGTEAIDQTIKYIDGILSSARASAGGEISLITFVWLVIWLMLCVERCFNTVWKVDIPRVWWKRLASYIVILLISPFLILAFLYVAITLSATADHLLVIDIPFFDGKKIFMWGAFFVTIVGLFTVMYKFIPNAKVKWKYAFFAAFLSGIAFVITQYLYIETQIIVTRMNAIYGVFAAMPLLMLWINIGWYIIVLGAQLSYSYQNLGRYHKTLNWRSWKKLIYIRKNKKDE